MKLPTDIKSPGIPIPLQDELALGLLGRFTRLNGLSSTGWAASNLRALQPKRSNTPLLWLIAAACGQEPSKFSATHSMLPVAYPISPYVGGSREASSKHSLTRVYGMSTPTEHLRWCPECNRVDVEERGFGHWRRQHQIFGVDWCIDHRVPLRCAPLEMAIYAPGHPATISNLCTTPADIRQESNHPALIRLQEIMVGWLQRPNPVRLSAWTQVIGEKCRETGFRMGEIGKRPVVSDRIQEVFPTSWLARHMPEIADKKPRTFVRKIDGAYIDKHVAYPARACATILAVLFESSKQALDALDATDRELSVRRLTCNSSGAALAAFFAGLSLHEACTKFGADIATVEAALRLGAKKHLQEPVAQAVPS